MKRLLLTALLVFGAIAFFNQPTTPDHRLFINGEVFTVNQNDDVVDAISIRNGLIESVGTTDEIIALKESKSIVTDLKGRSLLPGFIDAHSHFPVSGVNAVSVNLYPPPIGAVDSIDAIIQAMSRKAKSATSNDWLIGFGYDDSLISPSRHPSRDELDKISADIPIFLWHQSGHFAVVNSAGLHKLNIKENTLNPIGGEYGRDQSGRLNGLLIEQAVPGLASVLSDKSWLDYYRIFQSATQQYLRAGITTAQSGAAPAALTRALYWATQFNFLPFRIVVFPRASAENFRLSKRVRGAHKSKSSFFRLGPIKLFADGSPQGYTAYLSEPYHTQRPSESGYRGAPAQSLSELAKTMASLNQSGFQLAIHANGDAAIQHTIAAFKRSGINPHSDHRTILIHAQMLTKAQIPQLANLGISPSFFTSHTYYFGDLHFNRVMGPERANNISPAASALQAGLRISLHSDAPVTPINPLQLIWSAMERQTATGRILGENEKIDLRAAVRGITLDAAWQIFEDHHRGSLQPGKAADIVILSGALSSATQDIRTLSVDETIVGGKSVFINSRDAD